MTTKYTTIKGPAKEVFKVQGPLYCPYFNLFTTVPGAFGLKSYNMEAFEHNPFTIGAGASSGSPVTAGWQGPLYGFLNYAGIEESTFSYDGKKTLTINIPEGQELYVAGDADLDAHWKQYNELVMKGIGYQRISEHPDFWSSVEYCTWVEQKYLAGKGSAQEPLSHEMVEKYVDEINACGFPKGRVTLDHGWSVDPLLTGYGDWKIDEKKFPQMERTCEMIREKGHVPGLWLGLPKAHPQSQVAKEHPEYLGGAIGKQLQEADGGTVPASEQQPSFLDPSADLADFFGGIFSSFHETGFRKFKIDMSYGPKHRMVALHEKMYRAAKDVDTEIEMEFHLPDIFGAKWCDTVRTNDVWCVPFKPWYELTFERYVNCYRSAPGRLINRDHIGGNHIDVTKEDFLAHLETYRQGVGYPLVSLLPGRFGDDATQRMGEILAEYDGERKAISDF
jgi:hypothetical protein